MRRGAGAAVVIAAVALSIAVPVRAGAGREAGDWRVTASGDGAGCFLTKRYDGPGGTTLLLGVDADGANRLTVLNDNWSIRPRDQLKLGFRLSTASFPDHLAIGIAADAQRGFVASFGADFPTAFATSRSLRISRGKVPVEDLDLGGAKAAVAELRDCVGGLAGGPPAAAGKGRPSIPLDPFAAPPPRARRK